MQLVVLVFSPTCSLTKPNSFAVPLSRCLSFAVVPFFFLIQPGPASLLHSLLFTPLLLSLSLPSPFRCVRIHPPLIPSGPGVTEGVRRTLLAGDCAAWHLKPWSGL